MEGAPFVLWLDEAGAAGNPILGGKFSSLAEGVAAGFSIPPGFGVTTVAYRHFMQHTGLADEARRIRELAPSMTPSDMASETAYLREAIATKPMPEDLEEAIRRHYGVLEQRTSVDMVPVAVRSSGESEDLAGASFAGQYDTFLWICGADAILENIRACWAGMFGEAVLSYRVDDQNVFASGDFGMCVGIQQMVQARAAGVMFSLDPLNGDRSKVVMEAVWGLGEGVVKGDITPSQFTVDKVTLDIVRRKTVMQTEEYRFDPDSGAVRLAPLGDEFHDRPCLEDGHVKNLATLAKHIERTRSAPQDIEWAIGHEGEIRVLQVRPETVWSRRKAEGLISATRSPVGHVLARFSGKPLTGGAGSAKGDKS